MRRMFKRVYVLIAATIGTLVIFGGLVATASNFLPASMTPASEDDHFSGISANAQRDKNILIVHGIGTHCLGYADQLIENLLHAAAEQARDASGTDISRFYKEKYGCERYGEEEDFETQLIPRMAAECKLIHAKKLDDINRPYMEKDGKTELERISAYDVETKYAETDCFEIEVCPEGERCEIGQESEPVPKIKTVGYVRVVEASMAEGRKLKFFEVTWSPAAHWAKASLQRVQRNYKRKKLGAWLNQSLKGDVVNSAIADAVAYLGKSGVLVNYTILQSLCVVVAKAGVDQAADLAYSPRCGPADISASSNFSDENELFIITHSLGTRVLFDSMGLLATGVVAKESAESGISPADAAGTAVQDHTTGDGTVNISSAGLVTHIADRFREIGVVPPMSELNPIDFDDSQYLLNLSQGIQSLIESIQSVYVFTNQIPLLYSHIGSPYKKVREDLTWNFTNFLKVRNQRPGIQELEIVSFHDADDLLSYDLKCWYHETLLLDTDAAQNKISVFADKNAEYYNLLHQKTIQDECADDKKCAQDFVEFFVRKDLKLRGCFEDDYVSSPGEPDFKGLYNGLWETQEGIKFFNVNVFMTAFRVGNLFANPQQVHSNYFERKEVAKALVTGLSD